MNKLHGSVGAIVFFAIFVFFTCATVLYYERHRSSARRLLLLRAASGFGRELGGVLALGAVPVLWEAWTKRAVGGEEKLLWDQIMPFSVSVVHAQDDPSLNPSPQPSPESATDSVVQVVVTIAMPSPHDPTNPTNPAERDPSGEVREWHIGIAELPWSSEQSVGAS